MVGCWWFAAGCGRGAARSRRLGLEEAEELREIRSRVAAVAKGFLGLAPWEVSGSKFRIPQLQEQGVGDLDGTLLATHELLGEGLKDGSNQGRHQGLDQEVEEDKPGQREWAERVPQWIHEVAPRELVLGLDLRRLRLSLLTGSRGNLGGRRGRVLLLKLLALNHFVQIHLAEPTGDREGSQASARVCGCVGD